MAIGSRSTRYRVNEPAVIHQEIDGELVVIHLDRGLYYSVNPSGARIWRALLSGATADDVLAALSGAADAPAGADAETVTGFIEQLRAEELIEPAGDASADSAPDGEGSPAADLADGRPLGAPAMQRYEDLQDLLLLDPIHAVDESGWPERRDGA